MRIAALTGLLACTLVFVGSSQSASASEQELLAVQPNESVSFKLVAVADTTESELFEESKKESTKTIEQKPKQHVVKENESLSDVAEIHETTWKRIYDKNETIQNPDLINPGDELVIPDPTEELPERGLPTPPPVQVRTASSVAARTKQNNTVATTQTVVAPRGSNGGNLYTAGNCTWYVKSRRPDLPNNLGNANTWASRAASQGISTGSTPRVGAVAQARAGMHVAYVTAVNGDGTITISEMNYRNLYEVSSRVTPASNWIYIY